MGQILNIEIKENGITLANAYYHWSGYTSDSLDLLKQIMENVHNIKQEDSVLYAIRLLEKTGALLKPEELESAQRKYKEESFRVASNRNDGFISITEKCMQETRTWDEERLEIFIDEEFINFSVFSSSDKESYLENYDETEEGYLSLPVHALEVDDIAFDEFNQFAGQLSTMLHANISSFRTENGDVISFL